MSKKIKVRMATVCEKCGGETKCELYPMDYATDMSVLNLIEIDLYCSQCEYLEIIIVDVAKAIDTCSL